MEFIDFTYQINYFFPALVCFVVLGWTTHRRTQCNDGCGICARFDVSVGSNQSREFSTLSITHWFKSWPSYCRCNWSSKGNFVIWQIQNSISKCILIHLKSHNTIFGVIRSMLRHGWTRAVSWDEYRQVNGICSMWCKLMFNFILFAW